MTPLVVLGVGNLLLGDDGVGVHAVRALAADPPGGANVLEVGTAVFDALAVLERSAEVIVVDAVDVGAEPGTVVRFELDAAEAGVAPPSLHAFDVRALLRSIPAGRRPRLTVVGVQPAVVAIGLELSAVVATRLPALLQAVREEAAARAAP